MSSEVIIRHLGLQNYAAILAQMQNFTRQRDLTTVDEIWLLEHEPVFTLGQAGKREHLLNPEDIPVIAADRGGQVTYHGPGQLICYLLCNLTELHVSIKQFIMIMQQAVIAVLAAYGIAAHCQAGAPGVYVQGAKICSLGIRVRKGCSYHGLSLNVAMDLSAFNRINPCGFPGLRMVCISDLLINKFNCDLSTVAQRLSNQLVLRLGYKTIKSL